MKQQLFLEYLNTKISINNDDAKSIGFFFGFIPLGFIVFALPILLKSVNLSKDDYLLYQYLLVGGSILLAYSSFSFIRYSRRQVWEGAYFGDCILGKLIKEEITDVVSLYDELQQIKLWQNEIRFFLGIMPPSVKGETFFSINQALQISGYLVYVILFIWRNLITPV